MTVTYPLARQEPLPDHGGAWLAGRPTSILNHYTVGCSDPHATLQSRGLSVHFAVMRDGSVLQYVDAGLVAFHAYEMSNHAIGIEHEAFPGTCDLTVVQLQASAALNAWLCGHFNIPMVRAPGANVFKKGIGSHNDGLEPGHNTWDPNGHYDGIWKADVAWVQGTERTLLNRSPWTATQYIDAVKAAAGGGDNVPDPRLTDQQVADLKKLLVLAPLANQTRGLVDGAVKTVQGAPVPAGPYEAIGEKIAKLP